MRSLIQDEWPALRKRLLLATLAGLCAFGLSRWEGFAGENENDFSSGIVHRPLP